MEAEWQKMESKNHDLWLYGGIRTNYERKEPETAEWAEGAHGVLYDIGANVGGYSLIAADASPNLVVYAFEPAFHNFYALVRNIIKNGFAGRIHPMCMAVAERGGVSEFNYRSLDMGSALSAFGEPVDDLNKRFVPALRQPMLAASLDELVFQFGLPQPDFIKLDVDSIEIPILRGAPMVLKGTTSVLVESNERRRGKTTHIMARAELFLRNAVKHPRSTNLIYGRGP